MQKVLLHSILLIKIFRHNLTGSYQFFIRFLYKYKSSWFHKKIHGHKNIRTALELLVADHWSDVDGHLDAPVFQRSFHGTDFNRNNYNSHMRQPDSNNKRDNKHKVTTN